MNTRANGYLCQALLVAASTAIATPAWAHARWFVDDTTIPSATYAFDGVYGGILGGAALFVIAAIALEHIAYRNRKLETLLFARLPMPFDLDWRVLSSSLGFVLIATSFSMMVMAPNLKAGDSPATHAILALQAVAGALFLVEARLRFAAALLVALPLISLAAFSPLKVIDYAFEFAGLGLAFWIVAPDLASKTAEHAPAVRPSRLKRQPQGLGGALAAFASRHIAAARRRDGTLGIEAASVIRTMLGIQLIILAAHDKIFEPGVSLAFVEKYSFVNVPALLGVPGFTNLHFVFGAGMAEIVFGLLLITNTAARLVAFLLAGLFTLTGLVFGLHEMLGHMPILFSLLVLVVQGGKQESALAGSRTRTSPALGTALATILLGIIGIAFEPKAVEARVPVLDLSAVSRSATGLSVPAALYGRFTEVASTRSLEAEAIRDLNASIKLMLATAKGDTRTEKDDLSSKLADLAIRYEMANGADEASIWLRFAVLTAACSPSEITSFRAIVKAADWEDHIARIPASLRAVLLPIAETAALKILKSDRIDGTIPWAEVSERAPVTGPDYVYTHTLACIARIFSAAGSATTAGRMQASLLE